MRTNPKSGNPTNRTVSRRRTVRPQDSESVALTAASEDNASVQDASIEAEIARLAYFLWEARGGNGGSAEEDWLRAEQEILARSKA